MANLSFNKLGLKKPTNVTEVPFGENTIEVAQFIPTFNKIHLVSSAVKSSIVDGVVNEMVLETSLHYLIIENYTNIKFSEKNLQNMIDTYDLLDSSGIIDLVLENLPEGEYDYLFQQSLRLAEKLDKLAISALKGYAGQAEGNKAIEKMFDTAAVVGEKAKAVKK